MNITLDHNTANMQREIKFRVCYTDQQGTKQMIYKDEDLMLSLNGTVYENYGTKEDPTWEPVFDAYEQPFIQQYTGIKDKNGKEIYEADIINCVNRGLYICNWSYGYFAVQHINKNNNCALLHSLVCCMGDSEVVGNIFENPELLK